MDMILLAVGISLFVVGFSFFAFAGVGVRLRALVGKSPWVGRTKLFLKIGIPVLLIGIVFACIGIGIQG